jgi:hypothetical protein
VGSHSKHSRKSAIVRTDPNQSSWTRKYPAITVAALAGTVVGGPGGVAAAISLGDHSPASTPKPATAELVPAGAASDASQTTNPAPPPVASSVKTSASGKTAAAPAGTTATAPSAGATGTTAATPSSTASAQAGTSAAASAKASALAAVSASAGVSASALASSPYASTTWGALEPVAFYGSQNTFTPTSDQWENARTIVQVAEQRGMPLYAAVIAVATSIQESRLINLTTATNADSLGLFQQRPSQGWGTTSQLTDPSYAANAFLAALEEDAPDFQSIYLWEAAQDVQRSGYPTAYAQWQSQATTMVYDIVNGQAPS